MTPLCPAESPLPSIYEIKPLSPDRSTRRSQLIASLLASIARPEDAVGLGGHHLGTYFAFKPTNFWENWLAGQVALLMFRIERNQRIERRVRDLAALRAIDCWEVDQAQLAERTAAKLAEKPGEAHAALWTTLAGCDWLLARWAELDTDDVGGWTTEQRALARRIYPFETSRLHRPGTIADHVAHLQAQRSRMVEVDQVERALVEADLADHLGPRRPRGPPPRSGTRKTPGLVPSGNPDADPQPTRPRNLLPHLRQRHRYPSRRRQSLPNRLTDNYRNKANSDNRDRPNKPNHRRDRDRRNKPI